MKLILKKDWDIPLHPPLESAKPKGFFVGRESEIRLLTNELTRKDSGSILVTGYRGVGKTSLVYKAVANVRSADENVVVVLISASQLQAEGETAAKPNPKRLIIESIIRRLYATTRDDKRLKEFKGAIENLYRKAVAADFKQTDALRNEAKATTENIREENSELQMSEKGASMLVYGVCWMLGTLLQFVPSLSDLPITRLAGVLLTLPIPFVVNFYRKTRRIETRSSVASKQADEVYQFDNSIGNLEFDLEALHRDLNAQGKKLIYIIDELDKLEVKEVDQLLKFFKNLFTLSEALFIFIADEAMYKAGWSSQPNAKRPIDYTYFSSRYFVSRPLYNDLRSFLVNIVEKAVADASDLEVFYRSLCFVAKNDFFDLRSAIADRITGFDSGHPVIECAELLTLDKQRARFHIAATAIFENKYMSSLPSRWQENEDLQHKLLNHMKDLSDSYSGKSVNDPQEESITASLLRDCNAFLGRLGVLEKTNQQTMTIQSLPTEVRQYRYTGSVPVEPPSRLDEPSEYEQRFMTEVERYCEFVRALHNAFRIVDEQAELATDEFWRDPKQYLRTQKEWGWNALSQIEEHLNLREKFKNAQPLPVIERTVLEQHTKQVDGGFHDLFMTGVRSALAQMLSQINPLQNLHHQWLLHHNSFFDGPAVTIRRAIENRNPLCVFLPDTTKQIAIVAGEPDVVRRLSGSLNDLQSTHWVVGIGDFNSAGRSGSGVHFINTNNPEAFQGSVQEFLKASKSFFSDRS